MARNASSMVSRVTDDGFGLVVARRGFVQQRVRVRLEPGHLGERVHRRQPPGAAPDHVQADVRGDLVQPGPEQRAAIEAVAGAPGPKERLLHGILGLVERGEHPVAVDVQLAPMALDERREGPLVAKGPHVDGHACAAPAGSAAPLRTRLPGPARCCRPGRGIRRTWRSRRGSDPRRARGAGGPVVERLAGINALAGQLRVGGGDVGDDEVQAVQRARLHLDRRVGHHRDRALGPVRLQLDDPEVAGGVVDDQVEAALVEIERLGAIDIRDGNDDEFELVVHGSSSFLLSSPAVLADLLCM